jgi:holliday junction DNA helicase RuvA
LIGYLKGTLFSRSPERVVLDVHGVGYSVSIPLSTFYELERVGDDQTIGLFIHTHVREDAIELFGFWTERERLLFEKLIQVSGIGPKLARVILSGMPAGELLTALAAGDASRLATIPGIGKKTAERMLVDLKDKVQALAAEVDLPDAVDLVQALVNLGYREKLARKAIAEAREDSDSDAFHDLLRLSLKRLSRV